MPHQGNLSAWIEVNGAQLTEYGTEHSADGTTTTCWIPSEGGKAFEICYRDSLNNFTTAISLSVDGIRCKGKVARAHLRPAVVRQRGVSITDASYKPFVFSDCKLIDDDDFVTLTPGIGEITVRVAEVTIQSKHAKPRKIPYFPPLNVHERAKKGVVHGTQLGDTVLLRSSKAPVRTHKVRDLSTFIFKYRPLDVLRADGIAPPALGQQPHPRAVPVSLGFIDLTIEEDGSNADQRRSSPRIKEIKKERSITLDTDVIDLTV
ncbi:unnamed protein product [Cyclocybe aegerita]|uniref:DUF7918 domain-containing protein n=1 Tax=Cyclocybe aegerita TaxID=1973307 RepID=A0A8S0W438_CYCAE|nr:unnamed protein product [Cyclocybe aegerita]